MTQFFKKYYEIGKYVISGGSAACVNLSILYILTDHVGLHYLQSAVLSFIAAFFVSFLLQKFWTFGDSRKEVIHWQMIVFLSTGLINLTCNALLIFIFVEVFHIWYLFSAILAGGLLAIITFFLYRNVIFTTHQEGSIVHALLSWLKNNYATVGIVLALCVTAFLATYRLIESPPTWLDEGIITQVAIQISQHGPHATLQTAPGELVSAGYVSTSFPVTVPIAASFWLFGIGLLQARAVMAVYIYLFVLSAYFFIRREGSYLQALFALFLVATFAPLYGNGKNVLGEVPGLFYLIVFLLLVQKIETKKTTPIDFALAGILLGLTVATKSIFLLLLLPVGIVFLCSRRLVTVRKSIAGAAGFAFAMSTWLYLQFGGETLGHMLAIYANPHGSNIALSIWHNALSFITKPEPFYAASLLGVWLFSIGIRLWKRQSISRAEYIAVGFALLVYVAFLRTSAYYRYFFLGEVLALLYLPSALTHLWWKKIPVSILYGILSVLVLFQLYQSLYRSWVADHYSSRRSEELRILTSLPSSQSIFVYQAPEAVVFLPDHMRYYQYIDIAPSIIVGQKEVARISQGVPDIVIIPQSSTSKVDLSHYRRTQVFDRYSLWYKREQ